MTLHTASIIIIHAYDIYILPPCISAHIKSFMAMMDDAGRKSQYINDLLKVFKTFFTYLEAEGYPKAGIRDNSCKQGKMLTFCTLLVGRLRPQSPDYQSFALWL